MALGMAIEIVCDFIIFLLDISLSLSQAGFSLMAGQLLTEFQRSLLTSTLESETTSSYRQRLQIMLMADAGKSQAAIARELGCSPQTVRHWTLVAKSGEAHNWKSTPLGRPKVTSDEYLARLAELAGIPPQSLHTVDGSGNHYTQRRWTAKLLSEHLKAETGICVSDRHINRLLKKLGITVNHRRSIAQGASNNVVTTMVTPLKTGTFG
jgi:transposase